MNKADLNINLNSLNDRLAAENRNEFKSHGVYAINIMGSPGAGKTTFLENVLPKLAEKLRVAVIEGDLATQNDALRIQKTGVPALQINTNGGCHLDAKMIQKQLKSLDVESLDLIIIENVGNLVCPASFDLGEDLRMVILSIAEGDDKPIKYPTAFLNADAAVITKTDLLPYLNADIGQMKRYISEVNPKVLVFETANEGGRYSADEVVSFIMEQVNKKREI